MDIHQHFLHLEQQLLQPEVRLDRPRLLGLIAEDFIEFGAAGGAWSREQVIAGLVEEVPIARTLSDFVARALSATVVLATYRCQHRYKDGTEALSQRSSIWQEQAQGWQMVFHQGTWVPA